MNEDRLDPNVASRIEAELERTRQALTSSEEPSETLEARRARVMPLTRWGQEIDAIVAYNHLRLRDQLAAASEEEIDAGPCPRFDRMMRDWLPRYLESREPVILAEVERIWGPA